ncbi:unnamed protein product [Boreogadus saida]
MSFLSQHSKCLPSKSTGHWPWVGPNVRFSSPTMLKLNLWAQPLQLPLTKEEEREDPGPREENLRPPLPSTETQSSFPLLLWVYMTTPTAMHPRPSAVYHWPEDTQPQTHENIMAVLTHF